MHQVLFRIPIRVFDWMPGWLPESIPVYGFGLMLFVTFLACIWMAGRRARKEGIAKERIQDLAIWIFVGGIIGARVVYMIQYRQSITQFFEIWNGGLVFYGSALGGLAGFLLAYRFVIQKHGLPAWKIVDIAAPAIAVGLCLGRIGCFLNGCCYGNVACADCPALHFPLSAPSRFVYTQAGHQTAAGFILAEPDENDPRSLVRAVEAGSPADRSGLKSGDRIVRVDGVSNDIIVEVAGKNGAERALENYLRRQDPPPEMGAAPDGTPRFVYSNLAGYQRDLPTIREEARRHFLGIALHDFLWDHLVNNWPRGQTDLALDVIRAGQAETISLPAFEPRTLGLHPTQLYESISAFLILLLLLAFYPFRRHDGEVMVLFMLCYSVHRFLNEMLRNDTDPVRFGMTLSQNGSIFLFLAALALLVWIERQPVQYRSKESSDAP